MPLLPGKKNIGRNITELREHGTRPRGPKQILAIALHVAGVSKKGRTLKHLMGGKKKS